MSNKIGARKLERQLEMKLSPVIIRNLHKITPDYAGTRRQRLLWAARNPRLVTAQLVKLRLQGEL